MKIKGLQDEDFINYKSPSMMIATCYCTFKCDKESRGNYCQNSSLAKAESKVVPDEMLIRRYIDNPITKAIVFGGLEPFEQFTELYDFIFKLRMEYQCSDTIVIYTGFNKNEIDYEINLLKQFENIIVKFGRFIPNCEKHFDDILGIYLASNNQYAEVIS